MVETNRSARQYFQEDPTDTPIWELLGLEGRSMEEVLTYCALKIAREISLEDDMYFHCVFTSLTEVSLSSDGYLAILNDITSYVKQREILEATVAERTAALQEEKSQLQDMNVTLRTVMKSVDMERQAFEESIGEIVHTTLLPALSTMRKEPSDFIRNCYLDILEDRLLKLNQGDKD